MSRNASFVRFQVLVVRAERQKGSPVVWSLLSGGGGGKIKVWRNLEGEMPTLAHEVELPRGPPSKHRSSLPKGGAASSKPPGVKALDCWPGSNELVESPPHSPLLLSEYPSLISSHSHRPLSHPSSLPSPSVHLGVR